MTHFITFGPDDSIINPEHIYRIDRVVETVTFTLVMPGMGAGSIYTDDFVFVDEPTAEAALNVFIVSTVQGLLTFADATMALTSGFMANEQMTKNTFRNPKLGTSAERSAILTAAAIAGAGQLVLDFEAAL